MTATIPLTRFLRACRVLVVACILVTIVFAFLAAGAGHVRDTIGLLVLVAIGCAAVASLTVRIRRPYGKDRTCPRGHPLTHPAACITCQHTRTAEGRYLR